MANIYRVLYTSSHPNSTKRVEVSATTMNNAIAAVKAADKFFVDVISTTELADSVIVGS